MRELVTLLCAGSTVAGMLTAISGVVAGEFKPVIIGFVMLASGRLRAAAHRLAAGGAGDDAVAERAGSRSIAASGHLLFPSLRAAGMCRPPGVINMMTNRTIVVTPLVFALALGFARGQDHKPESPPPEVPPPVTAPVEEPPKVEVPPVDKKPDKTGGFGGIGMPGGAGGLGGPGYSATWYPSQSVSGQPADLAFVRQSLNIGVPVWRDGADAILLSAGVRNTLFSTDTILPDSGRPFPGNLWNVNFGLNYMHKFDNGWSSGVMTGFGSASDQPFHGIREMNVNVAAFLRIPVRNDRDSWLLSIFYSPVGNLNFPIPGVAYAWNPSETLHINIGLPFTLMWRPIEDLTINASYVPLTNINARATYKVLDGLHVYTGYEFLNESYFLADRVNTTDRFMGFEQRVMSGIRWDVWRMVTLDVNAGYAFDRYYGEGKNQGSDLRDRVDVAPGAFLGGRLGVRF